MSSLFNQASLVVEPAVYENAKVYATKPFDGSGDLTFARASNATRVASNGLIEKVRTNLLLQSNTFDTTWTQQNTTLTGGQTGYDGSNDAWKIEAATTSTTRIYQSSSIAANTLITISLYAKVGNVDFIRFNFLTSGTNSSVVFDLTDGTTYLSTAIDTTWESVGGGWVRISATFVNIDAITESRIEVRSNYSTLTCDAGSFVYIQDAQLNYGLAAQDYVETTTTAVSAGPVSGLPRLDYLNSSCPKLLLEPQRTNLVTSSEWLDGSFSLASSATLLLENVTAPDGSNLVTKVQANSADDAGRAQDNLGTLGTNHIFSGFFKGTGVATRLRFRNNQGEQVQYNIDASGNFSLHSQDAVNGNYDIEDYGNGWYRIWFETTTSGALTNYVQIYPDVDNGTGSVYAWGLQAEAGTYPTSYIPTNGTSVTRVADGCYKTGISSLIGQTEGTIFYEFERKVGGDGEPVWLSDGTYTHYMYLVTGPTNTRFIGVTSGVGQWNIIVPALSQGVHKIAAAYKQNDIVLYIDGVNVGEDTTASIPPCSLLGLGYENGTIYNNADPYIQLLLFKTRLSNSDLAALTA